MDETWYGVVDKATGNLVSTGTVVADPLPDHLDAVPIKGQQEAHEMWDVGKRAFVPRPDPTQTKGTVRPVLDCHIARYANLERLQAAAKEKGDAPTCDALAVELQACYQACASLVATLAQAKED